MPRNLENIVAFGPCPRCGRTGTEDGSRLEGYALEQYQGKNLCQICIEDLKDQQVDKIRNTNEAEEIRFRNSIGMTQM